MFDCDEEAEENELENLEKEFDPCSALRALNYDPLVGLKENLGRLERQACHYLNEDDVKGGEDE